MEERLRRRGHTCEPSRRQAHKQIITSHVLVVWAEWHVTVPLQQHQAPTHTNGKLAVLTPTEDGLIKNKNLPRWPICNLKCLFGAALTSRLSVESSKVLNEVVALMIAFHGHQVVLGPRDVHFRVVEVLKHVLV